MHVQTASLVQFQFYRKQEIDRILCPNYLTVTLNMLQKQLCVPFNPILANNGVYTFVWCCFYGIKMYLISTKKPIPLYHMQTSYL